MLYFATVVAQGSPGGLGSELELGVQIAIVIGGGGNIWRGLSRRIAEWIATTAGLHGNARDRDQRAGVAERAEDGR